jgi:hypothetical protein
MAIVVQTLVPHASEADADRLDQLVNAAITQRGGPPAGLMRWLCEAIASDRRAVFADVGELHSARSSTRSPSSSTASADLDAAPGGSLLSV